VTARSRQAGFTLIEIMIALVVSTLLVAMIIGIFTSMSAAYRTQQQVAELQQVLQAAEVTVEADLRAAGFRCAQGFTWAGGGNVLVPALSITDGGGGPQQPDQIAIFYGDPSSQANVTSTLPSGGGALTSVTVDAVDPTWQNGDLVLLSVATNASSVSPDPSYPPEQVALGDTTDGNAQIPVFAACVLQIQSTTGNTVNFMTSGMWGTGTNSHCTYDLVGGVTDPPHSPALQQDATHPAMLYKFVAHAYRIDPNRKDLSVFQQSPSGGLVANDWTDLGIGFTDFQIASRWYEFGAVDNADSDTDGYRNWYSDGTQSLRSAASAHFSVDSTHLLSALQVSISFVVRTTRPVTDGTVTAATPQLRDPANVGANDIGNAPPVQLAGVTDSSRPQELRGNNIYRYATLKVDTRNLGVGR
jgi:prepilin-type N-terminal cleavage/methylation domain-containing protein